MAAVHSVCGEGKACSRKLVRRRAAPASPASRPRSAAFLVVCIGLVCAAQVSGAAANQAALQQAPATTHQAASLPDVPNVTLLAPPGALPETTWRAHALASPRDVVPATPAIAHDVRFTTRGDRHIASIAIEPGTSLYATGQVPGPLRRNGRVVEAWNTDAYGYRDDTSSLYTSHPWVLAVRADGTAFGVLAATSQRCEIDLRDAIEFAAAGPAYPIAIIEGDHPGDVVRTLAQLTGTMDLPPLWALGYHQCRHSYATEERVREIARTFRERRIPCDVIWMDIGHMDGYRVFTFDPGGYPDPASLSRFLHDRGFHGVWMLDPGIKVDPEYAAYQSGTASDVWVRNAEGEVFVGEVWPGDCVFPDFTSERVRGWWADLVADFVEDIKADGLWNDMNEPSVFDRPTKTMPLDARHRADPSLGGPGPHAAFHNIYGNLMALASRKGMTGAHPDVRPFVLSRAGHIGIQRIAATWTGDNTADWYHLDSSVSMVLNLGLSGQPFAGPDIGGFIGETPPDLFARWIGVGAMLPFARGHSEMGTEPKEPWMFGPEAEATARRAIERRMRLLPHLYTAFREASLSGMPVARPVFFADPTDPILRSEDDAFLLGAGLLVAPQLAPARNRAMTLPGPERGVPWRAFGFTDSGGAHDTSDPDLPVLRVRPGSIVATGPVMQHAFDRPSALDELTLVVNLDADGRASGTLYEDDGRTLAYTRGDFSFVRFDAERTGELVRVSWSVIEGERPWRARTVRVRLLLDGAEVVGASTGEDTVIFEVPVR
ncbi:MAG: TIM-barrel domain-containing protein [Planctomycetota bacterium]